MRHSVCVLLVLFIQLTNTSMCDAGLNLMSQFNLENITVYYTKQDELDPSAVKSVGCQHADF